MEENEMEWRTGKVTRGLRDKNQADFYLGRAPGAASSRLLLPSNQEKRDEGCNMAARIDSRHNLFLSALAWRIVLHRITRCFSNNWLPLFMLVCNATTSLQPHCLIISKTYSCLSWYVVSQFGPNQMGCVFVSQGVLLQLPVRRGKIVE